METTAAIELKNITKTFGSIVANKNVCLTVRRGEILSVLGENGSGKTTLMNMISGIYYPDEGQIFIDGKEVVIRSPKDAFRYGIGMIHQHFKLVDVFSAAENVVLGLKEDRFDMKKSARRIKEISEQYGFEIDPNKKIYEMSVSEKQTVEIVKVLYRGADILILDEPTAVLTPQETQKLFAVLRRMRDDGKAILIITHKLHEVMSLSDRVAVLRKGEYIGTEITAPKGSSSSTTFPSPPAAARFSASPASPAAASGSFSNPSPVSSISAAAPSSTTIPRPVRRTTCVTKRRFRSGIWASGFRLFRRIAWAWAWSGTWTSSTT